MNYVDGLRAMAVMGVLAYHSVSNTMDYHGNLLYHILGEGGHGIDLFFVISGFCLSYPTLKKIHEGATFNFDVIRFFARRIVRIWPTYLVAFALMFAFGRVVAGFGYQSPVGVPSSFGDLVQQLLLIKPGGYIVGAFWTLPIELRWYVMFPALLWLWAAAPRFIFFAVALAAAALYRMTPWAHIIDVAALPCFMMGIIAADIAIHKRIHWIFAAVGFPVSVAIALWLEPKGHLNYIFPDQIWWQAACFAFVVAAGAVPALRATLSFGPIVIVGVASYSIYLVHGPFIGLYGLYGGANVLAAFVVGLIAGIAVWMVAEQNLTAPPFRDRWVARIEEIQRWLLMRRLVGAPRAAELGSDAAGKRSPL